MSFPRSSGILLHPTSLPGPFGIGDFGDEAYRFADFLVASGQRLWQVLPLGPTGYGDSPYACYSAFAGNTLLISPERLIAAGFLSEQELTDVPDFDPSKIDFEATIKLKEQLLQKAFDSFSESADSNLRRSFEAFCEAEKQWLDDYALFRALKNTHQGKPWHEWDVAFARREPVAIARAREALRSEVEAQQFYQYLFFKQWNELKSYCNGRGIKLVGDIPIFVAHDSADVWTNPDQFKLESDGKPTVVAGVPPDYFSKTGQLWGNPIYNWERMAGDRFTWWVTRVRAMLRTVDVLRIDHFRGFVACWEIPSGDKTAEHGRWVNAPGRELFDAIRAALGDLPIIAEDLGVITPEVDKLRDDLGFPGMRILQFAFGSDPGNQHLPHNYHPNVVAYNGTHDNDTSRGWFESIAGEGSTRESSEIARERNFALRYLNSDGQEIHWDFIRAVLASCADTAIIPLQDVLGLGSSARMNLPSSTSGNWTWRFESGALTSEIGNKLRELSELYGR
ncbi:MAG TPA: 4-alpha-glucanotransferase [Pyrinomonadaceae bacterium]|nr:4-alpha-glucanotransferase [Pyrinomonadaceae bacterium]